MAFIGASVIDWSWSGGGLFSQDSNVCAGSERHAKEGHGHLSLRMQSNRLHFPQQTKKERKKSKMAILLHNKQQVDLEAIALNI